MMQKYKQPPIHPVYCDECILLVGYLFYEQRNGVRGVVRYRRYGYHVLGDHLRDIILSTAGRARVWYNEENEESTLEL